MVNEPCALGVSKQLLGDLEGLIGKEGKEDAPSLDFPYFMSVLYAF